MPITEKQEIRALANLFNLANRYQLGDEARLDTVDGAKGDMLLNLGTENSRPMSRGKCTTASEIQISPLSELALFGFLLPAQLLSTFV